MYQDDLFCDNEKFNFKTEREFQDNLYNYLASKPKIKNLKKELSINKLVRFDIYFEFDDKKYIIECKLIKDTTTFKTIGALLNQMLYYKELAKEQVIYLIAICGDLKYIEKCYGNRLLFPTSQIFTYFGFYFIIFNEDKPYYYKNDYYTQEEHILTYSNGNGYTNLTDKNDFGK